MGQEYGASPTLFFDWRRRTPERRHMFDAARHGASARGQLETAVRDSGGFDSILDELQRGVSAVDLVNGLGTTRGTLYRWLHDEPIRWARWRRARSQQRGHRV